MFGKLGKNIIKAGILIFIIAALVIGISVPALAAGTSIATPPPTVLHPVQGIVVSITGTTSFTIQDASQNSITINVDTNTKYYMGYDPSAKAYKSASFSDIAVGDKILARVDSGNTAKLVLIAKGPVIRQVKGTVTISGNNITIATIGGVTISGLTWGSNTVFIIKGVTTVPSGQDGFVTFNTITKVAMLVNIGGIQPSASVQ